MPKETADGVMVHTPDPEQYHELTEEQARVIGGKGTVIPSATATGGKPRTNPPNKIYIDPVDAAGNGAIVVDLNNLDANVRKEAIERASEKGTGDEAAIAAYEFMQASQTGGDPGPQGVQGEHGEPDTVTADSSVDNFPEPLSRGEPIGGDVDLQNILAQQSQMLSLMTQLVQKDQPSEIEEDEPVEVSEIAAEPESDEPVESMMPKREAVDLLNESFAALKIPGLEPVAGKPKFRVIFNLGDAGTHTAWYHWVGTHGNGLFLIYDTRFEYGMQYVPPNLGVNRSIRVDIPDNDASYDVYSLDFVHPFGVFDIVNLVVAESPTGGSMNTTMSDFTSSDYNELDEDLMKHIM